MSLFGWLTGADKAAKATNKAFKTATTLTQQGQQKATDLMLPGANYQPVQNKMFDLLGLNGAQGQENAFGAYRESPEVAYMREQGQQGALSAATASGHLGGTRTQNRVGEINQNVAQRGFGDFYSRLRDLYESTKGTAGGVASGYTGGANRLAELALGKGQAKAQAATASSPWSVISGVGAIGADLLGGWMGKPKTSTSIY